MRLEVWPPDRWAGGVADRWAERLRTRTSLRMCLATGTTPVPVFSEMRRRVAAGEVSFSRCEVFLLDEYVGLPPGHDVRCDAMLRRGLLEGIDLPPDRLHVFDVDRPDLAAACADIDRAIGDRGLDLAILGLGHNGHLGMNEPGTPFDAPTRAVELADETRQEAGRYGTLTTPPTRGVTVGLAPLMAAREVWLLATGHTKAKVVSRVLEGPVGPHVPATCLRHHPGAVLLADERAGAHVA